MKIGRNQTGTGRKTTSRHIRSGVINAVHCSSIDATKIRRCAKIIINCTDQIYPGLAAESAVCQGQTMSDTRYAWTHLSTCMLLKTLGKHKNITFITYRLFQSCVGGSLQGRAFVSHTHISYYIGAQRSVCGD